ncbi:hypothetical protein PsYK624_092430 [Phanerochaete sordida]|uniref:DUF6534 domain-containing protein n=1 Tax=Phanerochaete sordida TaxID=48140 RepID=A0A9P3LFX6_9APHY|nr:hypothetical protein PsYK624_092430 [Phanerochaete sordida]
MPQGSKRLLHRRTGEPVPLHILVTFPPNSLVPRSCAFEDSRARWKSMTDSWLFPGKAYKFCDASPRYRDSPLVVSTMELSTSPLPPLHSIPYQVGAAFILICIMFMLSGTLNAQAYFYANTYNADHYSLRIFVATVWSLESLHTALCLHFFYGYFVLDIGAIENLLEISWSIWASLFVEVTIVAICHGCYIARLWHPIEVLSSPEYLVFWLSCTSQQHVWVYGTWPHSRHGWPTTHIGLLRILLHISVSLAAFIDILLATLIIFYLRRHMAGFRSARGVFQTLIFLTVNTGAITVLGSLAVLLLLHFMPESLAYGATLEVIGKLYANSVLGFLNARQHLRGTLKANAADAIPLPSPMCRVEPGREGSTYGNERWSDERLDS